MDLAALTSRVREELIAQATRLELDPARLEIGPVLNWGGFVNRSFRVSDGRARYHVKLTSDPEARVGLERWRVLHSRLEERYHAPCLVSWIEVAGTGFAGPVCRWVEGRVPPRLNGAVLEEVLPVVATLHRDDELALGLRAVGDEPATCVARYLDTYHRRFVEDLATIETSPPPFLSPRVLQWMWQEAQALEADVRRSAAFGEPATNPTHGDLWADNLLVTDHGRWYIVDWDGLSLGDAVLDVSMLLGPSRDDLRPATAKSSQPSIEFRGPEAERFRLYARASLLDWIIDPLSDWVEAGSEPDFGEPVRVANERVHREALALYRRLYA